MQAHVVFWQKHVELLAFQFNWMPALFIKMKILSAMHFIDITIKEVVIWEQDVKHLEI
jgi:hypothetical protein